jgi:hypothetical protein
METGHGILLGTDTGITTRWYPSDQRTLLHRSFSEGQHSGRNGYYGQVERPAKKAHLETGLVQAALRFGSWYLSQTDVHAERSKVLH